MRRALALIALLGAAAGCGGGGDGDAEPRISAAEAAEATRLARTARVGWRVTTEGFGLERAVTVKGSGTTSLTRPEMDVRFDLAPALRAAGAEVAGPRRADVVVRGDDVYVKPPRVRGFDLPRGADWVALDLMRALGAGGGALTEALALDTGAKLDLLRGASRVEAVGSAKVGGEPTTHYRAEAARDQRFDVWVDERDRVRRLRQRAALPAQSGLPRGEVGITMELSGFGTAVSARVPSADDTYDATASVSRTLAAAG